MEFQTVIFCGGVGNRMPSLCHQNPKCFLPVAGVPMWWFPVSTAIRSGCQEILLIFREIHRHEVEKQRKTPPIDVPASVKLNFYYTDKENEDWGTADVLREIGSSKAAGKDLILLSGDFVTDGTLVPIIDQYRAHGADLCVFVSDHCVTGPEPGPKVKKSKGRDMIGFEEETGRIVFLASEDDFDQPVDALAWLDKYGSFERSKRPKYEKFGAPQRGHSSHAASLWRHSKATVHTSKCNPIRLGSSPVNLSFCRFPKVNMTAVLNDCHAYLLRRKHLEILQKQRNFSSVKADIIPYLLEQQASGSSSSLSCFLCQQSSENGQVIAHANNLAAYFEANKQIPRVLDRIVKQFSPGQSFDFKKTGISAIESRVEESAVIGSGSVIKRSMVGQHCHLSDKSRVQNSLLMDGVHIGKGATVANSILCAGVVVEEGADVNNCLVLNGQRIQAGAKVVNEIVEDDEDDDGAWAKDCEA